MVCHALMSPLQRHRTGCLRRVLVLFVTLVFLSTPSRTVCHRFSWVCWTPLRLPYRPHLVVSWKCRWHPGVQVVLHRTRCLPRWCSWYLRDRSCKDSTKSSHESSSTG